MQDCLERVTELLRAALNTPYKRQNFAITWLAGRFWAANGAVCVGSRVGCWVDLNSTCVDPHLRRFIRMKRTPALPH